MKDFDGGEGKVKSKTTKHFPRINLNWICKRPFLISLLDTKNMTECTHEEFRVFNKTGLTRELLYIF